MESLNQKKMLNKKMIPDMILSITISGIIAFLVYKNQKINIFQILLATNLYTLLLYNTAFIAFLVIAFRIFHLLFYKSNKVVTSKLKNKIVTIFTILAILPCLLVAIFATLLLNNSIQGWFSKNMSQTIVQASKICESYIKNNEELLKTAAINYANKIDKEEINATNLEYQISKTDLYGIFANVTVFRTNPNVVIASTDSCFSFFGIDSFSAAQIKEADANQICLFKISSNTICALVKMQYNEGTYLALTQTLDKKMLDYVDKTNGTVRYYYQLQSELQDTQIKFVILFAVIVIILIMIAMIGGIIFARQITFPIQNLVNATNALKKGNFETQVPIQGGKDEIGVLAIAFNEMVKRLQDLRKEIAAAQKEIIWSDVAKKVAHEINNPLTPMQLSAERLLAKFGSDHADNPIFKKYLTNILNNIDNIKDIISAFSYFGKLPNINLHKLDFVHWITTIIESRKIIKPSISYKLQSNQTSIPFIFDEKQMSQAISNLFLNSEQNFDIKKIQNPFISVYVILKNEKLKIIIADNGLGFPEQLLHSSTLQPYNTTKTSGTGLGLIITQKIIEDHNGQMKINNYQNDSIKGAIVELLFQYKVDLITNFTPLKKISTI